MSESIWTGDSSWPVELLSWSPSGVHIASGFTNGTILIQKAGSGEVQVGPIKTDHIVKGETSSFRLANLEILINAVLYNASAALHFTEAYKPGFAHVFFNCWFAAINGGNKLPRVHDKKLRILALCNPVSWWMLAYLEVLAKEGVRLREKSKQAEAGDDESDTSEESEIEEELGFFSLLDAINPYITFKQALQTFQNQNSNLYQAETTMLTVERHTLLMEVAAMAESQAGGHS
ncbi:hypothetical protein K503DRAFT_859836 [Rhizopogon vinicolor AM-OR11-026]|uniref:Anaphase-promoting complex subunit 4 WD40 domain-containing protein n=1 Tax=Rhizopogon vinicolor AM-OR11-026 TaxID=1314800 RepID=A0A1B7ML80_9AGAM|nr:hypothetical protein K503DRAFT_859836 [Rhizopogon vinicolor AM-OR11-026]